MLEVAGVAGVGHTTFFRICRALVWPAVDIFYKNQQRELMERAKENGVELSIDGQYDSPGHSAQLCCVTAIEHETNQVLTFQVVEKSETGKSTPNIHWKLYYEYFQEASQIGWSWRD
jgi:hypothetical protein